MDEVFKFASTFKQFPPRSFPPSFNPGNIMEDELDSIKRVESFKKNLDLDRIRGSLNQMIDDRLLQQPSP
jgi:hypothetical protein